MSELTRLSFIAGRDGKCSALYFAIYTLKLYRTCLRKKETPRKITALQKIICKKLFGIQILH